MNPYEKCPFYDQAAYDAYFPSSWIFEHETNMESLGIWCSEEERRELWLIADTPLSKELIKRKHYLDFNFGKFDSNDVQIVSAYRSFHVHIVIHLKNLLYVAKQNKMSEFVIRILEGNISKYAFKAAMEPLSGINPQDNISLLKFERKITGEGKVSKAEQGKYRKILDKIKPRFMTPMEEIMAERWQEIYMQHVNFER